MSTTSQCVYVLALQHGKYYVGITDDLPARMLEHGTGLGSAWTRLVCWRWSILRPSLTLSQHPPVRIFERRETTNRHDEQSVTLDMMQRFGVDNVRGGSWVRETLTEQVSCAINSSFELNA